VTPNLKIGVLVASPAEELLKLEFYDQGNIVFLGLCRFESQQDTSPDFSQKSDRIF
jgi:hypothetical protein